VVAGLDLAECMVAAATLEDLVALRVACACSTGSRPARKIAPRVSGDHDKSMIINEWRSLRGQIGPRVSGEQPRSA
jgi:hypothetical protein